MSDIQHRSDVNFESIKRVEKGREYWSARELMPLLDYSKWERFEGAINRAKNAALKSSQNVDDHFPSAGKMVLTGSGADRIIDDYHLSRYACYLIAQNGDPRKEAIAQAQTYFALQTRKQELTDQLAKDMERITIRHQFTESDKRISEVILAKEMSAEGLAKIKSSGDRVMFGGRGTADMKKQYGITKPDTPLANRMPNVVLAAKSLANEMTTANLSDKPIDTFIEIKEENDSNNGEVREALGRRGIIPEELPPAEDTTEIMKRIKNNKTGGLLEE